MARAERSRRPVVVAFDVVETLFSLEPVGRRLEALGLPPDTLDEWFARFLRDAVALDAAGVYTPFREVASGTLEVILARRGIAATDATVRNVLQAFGELPPHPDVLPAFEQLKAAGVRIVALTNGGADTTQRLLKQADLLRLVERVISIDEVRHWKPHRDVYLHATRVVHAPRAQVALVAAHAWDVLGAGRAGLTTGWVSRAEKTFHSAMGTPTVTGDTLTQVVTRLLAL